MGCFISTSDKFLNIEFKNFEQETIFNASQLKILYKIFNYYSKIYDDDGVIDYQEFCNIVKINKDHQIANNLFKILDKNNDNRINFREFVMGINAISDDCFDNYTFLLFNIIKQDNNDFITVENICNVANKLLSSYKYINIPKYIIKNKVTEILKEIILKFKPKSNLKNETLGNILEQIYFIDDDDLTYLTSKLNNLEELQINFTQFSNIIKINSQYNKWIDLEFSKIKNNFKFIFLK